jgi:hypothetical protein
MITLVQHVKLARFPNDQANGRAWLEQFERMRANMGWRQTTIHLDAHDVISGSDLPADALLRVAANDD